MGNIRSINLHDRPETVQKSDSGHQWISRTAPTCTISRASGVYTLLTSNSKFAPVGILQNLAKQIMRNQY